MGTIFRKWKNKMLKEYLLGGYVINENKVVISNENYVKLSNKVANINNKIIKSWRKSIRKRIWF